MLVSPLNWSIRKPLSQELPMPRVVRRYEIYLPLFYNDGTPVEPEKFDQVERELVEQFGGVTTVQRQFPLRGVWRGEHQTYLDLIVVFTVLDLSGVDVEHFFTPYKEALKTRFHQEEVLITMQELTIL
jgi:hypothetical protein